VQRTTIRSAFGLALVFYQIFKKRRTAEISLIRSSIVPPLENVL